METNKRKIFQHIAVFLLIILAVSFSFCAISKKESYHCDEIFTYGLSNSSYLPFWVANYEDSYMRAYMDYLKDGSLIDGTKKLITDAKSGFPVFREKQAECYSSTKAEWKSSDELFDYVAVTEGEQFDYLSVIYNQYADVHPPLYYFFIHTVSSFFPNTFSNYIAFSVNILFFIAIILLMFYGLKRYFGYKNAIIATFFYALSIGAMSMTVFFRMYTILTFFTLCCTLIHLELFKRKWEFNKKITLLLILTTVLGFYTQYYYIIFAVFTAFTVIALMIADKSYKSIWQYILRMIISGVISLIIWPFSILHIFFGYRGTNAFENAVNSNRMNALTDYADIIKHALLSDSGILGIIFTVIVILAVIILSIKKKSKLQKLAIPAIPAVCFIAVVAFISDFHDLRYVMCTLPMMAFLLTYSLVTVICTIPKLSEKTKFIVSYILIFAITLSSLAFITPKYLYVEDEHSKNVLKENKVLDCLYVFTYMYDRVPDAIDFKDHNGEVLFLWQYTMDDTFPDERVLSSDELLLYITPDINQQEMLNKIIENTQFTQYELLAQKRNLSKSYIYKLKK